MKYLTITSEQKVQKESFIREYLKWKDELRTSKELNNKLINRLITKEYIMLMKHCIFFSQ